MYRWRRWEMLVFLLIWWVGVLTVSAAAGAAVAWLILHVRFV